MITRTIIISIINCKFYLVFPGCATFTACAACAAYAAYAACARFAASLTSAASATLIVFSKIKRQILTKYRVVLTKN